VVKIAPSILAADFARLKAAGVHVGGQQFILATLEKIRVLKHRIESRHLRVMLEVDGAQNPTMPATATRLAPIFLSPVPLSLVNLTTSTLCGCSRHNTEVADCRSHAAWY
jgi:pentose-5-phosphate-3-epimerase